MRRVIVTTLYLLAIFIPLTLTTVNHELFEFPKFILLLSGTMIITLAWSTDLFFRRNFSATLARLRSPLSYAVLAVLATALLSTLFSLVPYTSFWGYYTRFHQGLLTTICYTIIYFAALNWLDRKSTQKLIKITVGTAIIICVYGILEHFGIDKNFWRQDVQNRIFSTLGQPNWLAAYVIPNLFLALYLHQKNLSAKHSWRFYLAFAILFAALIFTKSRSGFLGFFLALFTYWLLHRRSSRTYALSSFLRPYLIGMAGLILIFGTPFTPTLSFVIGNRSSTITPAPTGTVLESGGTESGDIRKIVWSGALKLIAKHPLLGTGPETFAYTYYWERPQSHNLTSEWDFIYNKAHNEYLNIAAGTGVLGLIGYLYWHYAIFTLSFSKIPTTKKMNQHELDDLRLYYPVVGASVVAFAVTNFFGFSVIPVYFFLVIISALPSTFNTPVSREDPLPAGQIMSFYTLAALSLVIPLRLWLADYYFTRGKAYLDAAQPIPAISLFEKSVRLRPGLDLFHSYLGESYAGLAASAFVENDEAVKAQTQKYLDLALRETEITKKLNPYHLNYFKSRAKTYLTLALIDEKYNLLAVSELVRARELAPTDPKLAYNLGLVYTRTHEPNQAIEALKTAISLKPDYPDPYYALALLYEQTKQTADLPALMENAVANLATYSSQLGEKITKYTTD